MFFPFHVARFQSWFGVWSWVMLSLMVLFGSTANGQFDLQGPGVDPADFRVTTFASGLNFPVGMVELSDGSILVGVSNQNSFFGSSSGSILRLADTDNDGIADQQTTLVDDVPLGGLTTLRTAGDLVFTTGQGGNRPIAIYRLGDNPTDPLTSVGSLTINYPGGGWLHPHSALATRVAPGQSDTYELYFQLGSDTNFAATTRTASLTSDIGVSGTLAGDAIHRVTLTDNGTSITGANLTQIATGTRNAAGFDFHPYNGDLYFEDNGIDGVGDPNEPTSADELNILPAAQIGGAIESYGFPDTYVEYRTGTVVGNSGIQPDFAFQPIPAPNGAEGEGANDIAFAPRLFPEALRNGVFVGMHGKFFLGGLDNEENPLVFANLEDGSYFHFIGNDEPNIGHPDGLLSTLDSLFVADLAPGGGFSSSDANSGNIYQIRPLVTADFDSDRGVDCADADALTAVIASGTNDLDFDLTGDGAVDLDDLDQWLTDAGAVRNANGNSMLPGDANLDGIVDGLDFITWNEHKFTTSDAYCSGDFNADGVVDGLDFIVWNDNKFSSSDVLAVPEPCWGLGWVWVVIVRGRRRLGTARLSR